MNPTHNDLAPEIRSQMADLLNARLADAIDLRLQVKVAHWNVKGPRFRPLHKLFDDIAEDVDGYVDLVAERSVQLGGSAQGTARQVAEASSLEEYAPAEGRGSHLQAVCDALASYARNTRQAIRTASAAGDEATADIFIEIQRGADQWLWMVEAHLQGEDEVRPRRGRGVLAGEEAGAGAASPH